jgi:CRP-like cAMP-binding protein
VSPLFSGIIQCDHDEICAAARTREFARGELLFLEGDSVKQIVMLKSGIVKITQLGFSGTQVILRLGIAGDLLNASSLFSSGRLCTTAHAFRYCRALVWDTEVFKNLVRRYPILYQNMARSVGEHLQELEERFREVATEKAGARVAHQMVRLLEQIGQSVSDGVEISLSREELAQMTGTTLFTVSRLLSGWEALGMVKPRREAVTVCDVSLLRTIAE